MENNQKHQITEDAKKSIIRYANLIACLALSESVNTKDLCSEIDYATKIIDNVMSVVLAATSYEDSAAILLREKEELASAQSTLIKIMQVV